MHAVIETAPGGPAEDIVEPERVRANRARYIGAQGGGELVVGEAAIGTSFEDSDAGQRSQRPIQSIGVRTRAHCQVFRAHRAVFQEVGDAELSGDAERSRNE